MTKPNELEATSEETPFPADLAVEDVVEALVVLLDVLPPVAVVATVPVPVECVEAVAVEAVEEEGNKLAGSVTLLHERLYSGVVLNVESLVLLPTRPKLGSGVVGAASWRTYHQVLTLPKADAHPTSSQNVCALASLGDPNRFSTCDCGGGIVCSPEEVVCIINAVAHGVLEIWVLIHAQPVHSFNNSVVR
jgi:hypothetical protein